MSTSITVIYDSINNSVFESLVVEPLKRLKAQGYSKQFIVISFEADTTAIAQKRAQLPPWLQVIVLKRWPYVGRINLYWAAWQLRSYLEDLEQYPLRARGPLAGMICLRAQTVGCTELLIQARGLLAEEYAYTHQHSLSLWQRSIHRLRYRQFKALEHAVYKKNNGIVRIEAVSEALRDYLIQHYNSNPQQISCTQSDLPPHIPAPERLAWHAAVRTELALAATTHVYCYNGSYKPWQCPEQIVQFFKERMLTQPDSFLLIITTDYTAFKQHLQNSGINAHYYKIVTVPHATVGRYLSACNTGIIFRDKTVLNWVSRPTKVLEYQAAGLEIEHNNTIGMLTSQI